MSRQYIMLFILDRETQKLGTNLVRRPADLLTESDLNKWIFWLIIFCNSDLLVSCFMELWVRYKLVAVCYWSMTAEFITLTRS